jgi:hypothetical protein
MTLFSTATDLVTWRRTTGFVLEPVAVSASLSSDRAPAGEACIQVRLQGNPSGGVVVSGTVDGSPDSETLTWDGSGGYRVTRKRFTGSVSFSVAATGGTTISAKAVSPGGEPVLSLYTVRGPGHPVSRETVTMGRSPVRRPGDQEEGSFRFMVQYEDVWKPRKGDRVTDDRTGHVYEILRVEQRSGGLAPMAPFYWSCPCKMLESTPGA